MKKLYLLLTVTVYISLSMVNTTFAQQAIAPCVTTTTSSGTATITSCQPVSTTTPLPTQAQ